MIHYKYISTKSLILRLIAVFALILLQNTTLVAESVDIVQQFGNNLSTWASTRSMSNLHLMENLCSKSPSFRIGNRFMTSLADKNGLTKTDTYDWDSYVVCLQKEIDNGIRLHVSNISEVPEEYVEVSYPGVKYVSCIFRASGSTIKESKDLFILKNDRIVKITDYIEHEDKQTGKKKIEIDYLDLARAAFADKDYQKCYNLYQKGGLKALNKQGYACASDVFPYVESCVALSKWDEAMHGITDRHRIMNHKYWVNGIEWELKPDDLKNWTQSKKPLMDVIFQKICLFYSSNLDGFKTSPIINNIGKVSNIPISKLVENGASFLWRNKGMFVDKIVAIRGAAEFGYAEAQREIAKKYLTGYNDSESSGSVSSSVIPCDSVQALNWFDRAARNGDSESAIIAAAYYLTGAIGEKDYSTAFSFYKISNGSFNYASDYGLGLCYYYGLGVDKNQDLALQHLLEAEDWHRETPFLIGKIYLSKSNPLAIKYLNKVITKIGIDEAVKCEALLLLTECYLKGKCGTPIDLNKADKFAKEASQFTRKNDNHLEQYFTSLTLNNI